MCTGTKIRGVSIVFRFHTYTLFYLSQNWHHPLASRHTDSADSLDSLTIHSYQSLLMISPLDQCFSNYLMCLAARYFSNVPCTSIIFVPFYYLFMICENIV